MPASFWERANDIKNRAFPYRLTRFVRARLSNLASNALTLVEEPRVRAAWARNWEQDHYVRLLRYYDEGFRPKVIYDIGGHQGLWAEMAQAIFNPDGIIVFEPQKSLHSVIDQRRRPSGSWQILDVALGDRDEARDMHVTDNEAASSLLQPVTSGVPETWRTNVVSSTKVAVRTLDNLARELNLPKPDFVKIDVQGFEGQVLKGGASTFPHARRMVVEVSLREIYQGQAYVPEILAQANELGFALEDINDAVRDHSGRLWQADLWLRRKQS
ncbi:MAG TPA: FkbM family methyltransferase [Methylomirabilota bacterium]|nr:FkbM family methyltransferase [Methylomirabilota bacterium]